MQPAESRPGQRSAALYGELNSGGALPRRRYGLGILGSNVRSLSCFSPACACFPFTSQRSVTSRSAAKSMSQSRSGSWKRKPLKFSWARRMHIPFRSSPPSGRTIGKWLEIFPRTGGINIISMAPIFFSVFKSSASLKPVSLTTRNLASCYRRWRKLAPI